MFQTVKFILNECDTLRTGSNLLNSGFRSSLFWIFCCLCFGGEDSLLCRAIAQKIWTFSRSMIFDDTGFGCKLFIIDCKIINSVS